jgi:hypothetical protein
VTEQPGQPVPIPAVDPGNTLLSQQPAQLLTARIMTPQGPRLVLTIRTTSATVSVLLTPEDAKTWAAQLSRDAALSSSGLLIVPGSLPKPNGAGKP